MCVILPSPLNYTILAFFVFFKRTQRVSPAPSTSYFDHNIPSRPLSFTWRHRYYDCPLGSFKTSVDESRRLRVQGKSERIENSELSSEWRGIISSTVRFISLITFVEHDNGQRNLALKWNWVGREHPPLKLLRKGPCISPSVISRTTVETADPLMLKLYCAQRLVSRELWTTMCSNNLTFETPRFSETLRTTTQMVIFGFYVTHTVLILTINVSTKKWT